MPLCDRTVAIVQELAKTYRSTFVFPGIKPGKALSEVAVWTKLNDMQEDITMHGFRSSFRDWAGEATSAPHDVCEAALACKRRDKVHSAYQRGDLFEKRRELMLVWAEHCEPQPAADIAARRSQSVS